MAEKLRLDKWLWHGRFFKTRARAAEVVDGGAVRVNATRVTRRSTRVTVGDVLTFPQARRVRIIRVDAIGVRRGPAQEAQGLYTDLSPPDEKKEELAPQNPAFDGKGRPTKKDRRTYNLSRARSLD